MWHGVLYRVCRVGNGINWKGQVFGRMRNWTANNRQTGVGNSLKKHYANFLWEYEQVGAGRGADRGRVCVSRWGAGGLIKGVIGCV